MFAGALGAVALATGTLAGAAVAGTAGGVAGAVAGGVVAVVLLRLARRRSVRRRALIDGPFPAAWREVLEKRYDHYDRLPAELRRRFEDDLRIFIGEKRISGVFVEVTDELRILVAASAVTVSLGWPSYEWDELAEVLLYPDDFDRDYNFGGRERVGETHSWGSIILSVPALHESFDDPDDAYHVGLHEFAHLLDKSQGQFDGIPPGLDAAGRTEWVKLAEREMALLRDSEEERPRARSSLRKKTRAGSLPRDERVIDPYGAHDPVEFLAVAVEAFFEASLVLRRQSPDLYALLARYFRQDPARWDDERGLVE